MKIGIGAAVDHLVPTKDRRDQVCHWQPCDLRQTLDPFDLDRRRPRARDPRAHAVEKGRQVADLRLAGEAGVKIVISSDSHEIAALSNLEFGVGQARRGWLGPEQILNTRPWGEVKKLLKKS